MPLGPAENAHNNRLSVGVWAYTSHFNDVLDVDANGNPVQRSSHGMYAMIEKVLACQAETRNEKFKSFVRIEKRR